MFFTRFARFLCSPRGQDVLACSILAFVILGVFVPKRFLYWHFRFFLVDILVCAVVLWREKFKTYDGTREFMWGLFFFLLFASPFVVDDIELMWKILCLSFAVFFGVFFVVQVRARNASLRQEGQEHLRS